MTRHQQLIVVIYEEVNYSSENFLLVGLTNYHVSMLTW
jgi:hypothetical protein